MHICYTQTHAHIDIYIYHYLRYQSETILFEMELKASGIYIKVYHYVAVEKYAKDSKQLEQSVAPDSFAMLAWWLAVIFWGSMFYLIQLA